MVETLVNYLAAWTVAYLVDVSVLRSVDLLVDY